MVLIVSCLTLLADNSMSLLCRVYSTGSGITGTNSQIEDLVDEYRYELSTVIEFALVHAHHKVFKRWVNFTSLCQKLRNWLLTNLLKILRIDNGASLRQPGLMSLILFHENYFSVEANNLLLFNIYFYPHIFATENFTGQSGKLHYAVPHDPVVYGMWSLLPSQISRRRFSKLSKLRKSRYVHVRSPVARMWYCYHKNTV